MGLAAIGSASSKTYRWMYSQVFESRFGKSIVGRIALCAGLEGTGSFIGCSIGRVLCASTFSLAARFCAPLFGCGACLYALKRKTAFVALGVLSLGLAIYAQCSFPLLKEWGATYGFSFGEWFGAKIGMIFGGYAGLAIAQRKISFWDSSSLSRSYVGQMTRYLLAGAFFEAAIVRSTFPYLHMPINWIRGCFASYFKAAAYHSDVLIHDLRDWIRKKRGFQEAIFPPLVKALCHRYIDENEALIINRIAETLSRIFSIVPLVAKNLNYFLRISLDSEVIKRRIEFLEEKSDRFTIILMRAFDGYIDLLPTLQVPLDDAEQLKLGLNRAFQEKFPGQGRVLCSFLEFSQGKIEEVSKKILEQIQQMEVRLIGCSFIKMEKVKALLALHIHYFLLYFLLCEKEEKMTFEDEKRISLKICQSFFSLYNQPCLSHLMLRGARKAICLSLTFLFGFKKWVHPLFEQPEERATASSSLSLLLNETSEDYFQEPLASYELDALKEGWTVVTNSPS